MNFDVTTTDIRNEIQGFTLTATSTPSLAYVETVIEESAGEVRNELRSKDIAIPDADSTGVSRDTYLTCRKMVIALVCDRVATARARGRTDAGQTYRAAYRDARSTLRGMPAKISPNRAPGAVNAPRTLRQQNPDIPTTTAGRLARSRRGL